jgi:hypothetical protein
MQPELEQLNHQVRCILMHGINCKIDCKIEFVDENKFKIELQNKRKIS